MKHLSNSKFQEIISVASKDFDEADPVRSAFINIVSYIFMKPRNSIRYLSFGMLREVANLDNEDGETLHRAIAYLTGERAKILDLKYEYSMDSYHHELDNEEIETFISKNIFYDPRSGLKIENCSDFIFVFFRPNSKAFH